MRGTLLSQDDSPLSCWYSASILEVFYLAGILI